MDRVDEPDEAALVAHHQRVGAGAAAEEADAAEQVAVGDAAGAEEDVVAGGQLGRVVDLVVVLALLLAFAGFAGIVVGRMLREGSEAREAAGNVLLLAIAFAVISLLTLEFVLPPLEKLLGLI